MAWVGPTSSYGHLTITAYHTIEPVFKPNTPHNKILSFHMNLLTKGTPKSLAGLIRYEYRSSGGYKISKNTSPAITSAVEAPSWKCKSLAVKRKKYLNI